jgi:membrane protein CcdC involved in cytochrome C biogenesis
MNELERWANFYLLTSAAAATLTGLLFVVITLGAERRLADTDKIRVYLTPTATYFACVLFLAALLTFPNHTRLTATLCICLVGIVGLVYSGSFLIGQRGKKTYYELHDRIAYAAFPFAAYALLVLGGVLFLHAPQRGLTVVAAGMLSLLAVAIRNSWAIAIGVACTPPGRQNSK